MHLVLQVFQVLFNKFVLIGPVDKSTFGQTEFSFCLVKLISGKILKFSWIRWWFTWRSGEQLASGASSGPPWNIEILSNIDIYWNIEIYWQPCSNICSASLVKELIQVCDLPKRGLPPVASVTRSKVTGYRLQLQVTSHRLPEFKYITCQEGVCLQWRVWPGQLIEMFVWCLYGVCMLSVCCLYGVCMMLIWCLYDVCMVYVLCLYGVYRCLSRV